MGVLKITNLASEALININKVFGQLITNQKGFGKKNRYIKENKSLFLEKQQQQKKTLINIRWPKPLISKPPTDPHTCTHCHVLKMMCIYSCYPR